MSWRRGCIGVAVLFVVIGLLAGPTLIHRQVLGLGATDIHDAHSLPDHIDVCGRQWSKDTSVESLTQSQVQSKFGRSPALVDPLPFAPCPPGPCTRNPAHGPCDTVVIVRVGEDAYVNYSLSGGP